ncbi:MAG TPA: TetR/AcrR family transcriptional regulator [Dermatophilaceae bacterium]|nr:TetR/AcrR family transcriptional regulator [Dermatophilaceae bacterium]
MSVGSTGATGPSVRSAVGLSRARGTRLPRSARRAQLLQAAQAAFVEHGYHAAAMDDIADRAGVSKPVLYQHFPGKLELYMALLEQRATDLEREVRAALESTSDNKARVFATVRAYFAFVEREGSAFRLLFESDLINDDAVSSRIDRALQAVALAFADAIVGDTGMARDDALVLATALTGMAQVSARAALVSDYDSERASRLVGQLAWRGLGGFPKSGDVAPAPGDASPPAVSS